MTKGWKQMTTKLGSCQDFCFVVALKRTFWMVLQSAGLKFSWTSRTTNNLITVSFIGFSFYHTVDLRSMRCFKITTVESLFPEPSLFFQSFRYWLEPKVVSPPQSNAVILPSISRIKINRDFRFPWRFQNSEFRCVFGKIIVSLEIYFPILRKAQPSFFRVLQRRRKAMPSEM